MDGAGLGTMFSTPRQSFGATANATPGRGSFGFSFPAVNGDFDRQHNSFAYDSVNPISQGRQQFGTQQTVLPFLGAPLPNWGGGRQQSIPPTENLMAVPALQNLVNVVKIPRPANSFINRLDISSTQVVRPRRSDMKSVDKTPKLFTHRYAALPSEDWILHIDNLETEMAIKHEWIGAYWKYR